MPFNEQNNLVFAVCEGVWDWKLAWNEAKALFSTVL